MRFLIGILVDFRRRLCTFCGRKIKENGVTKENNFKYSDFLLTIIYRFPQETNCEWKWLDGVGEDEGEIKALLEPNCNSTFNYLLKTGKPYYFNNSMENAIICKNV